LMVQKLKQKTYWNRNKDGLIGGVAEFGKNSTLRLSDDT
jgi:hypothetical protein